MCYPVNMTRLRVVTREQDILPVTSPPPLQKNKEDLPHYINTPLSVTQTQVQRSHKNSGYYSGKIKHSSKQIFWLLEMCEALLIRWCKSVRLTKWVVLSLWSGQALPATPLLPSNELI